MNETSWNEAATPDGTHYALRETGGLVAVAALSPHRITCSLTIHDATTGAVEPGADDVRTIIRGDMDVFRRFADTFLQSVLDNRAARAKG